MKFILLLTLSIFTFCNNTSVKFEEFKGKYYTVSKDSYIKIDKVESSFVLGNHCFVSYNGRKIDCCIDDISSSFKLLSQNDSIYIGEFISCYDDAKYDVKMLIRKNEIILNFIDIHHPFMTDKVIFKKEK